MGSSGRFAGHDEDPDVLGLFRLTREVADKRLVVWLADLEQDICLGHADPQEAAIARVRGLGLGLGLGRQRGDQKLALTPTQYRRPMASYAYDAVVEPVTLPGTPDTISGGLVFIALSMPR